MKKLFLLSTALMASGAAQAQAQALGRVLSATPLVAQVGLPRQVCHTEAVAVPQQTSGAGALVGAIAGGAVGNAVGGGSGKAAATVIGLVGGAILGERIEGAPPSQLQNVQRCTTQNFVENRTVAYNVVYEFSGKQYAVQLPQDPGPTIALQVTPVGANMAPTPPPVAVYAQPVYAPLVYAAPAVVVLPQAYRAYRGDRGHRGYRGYDQRLYDAPLSIELDIGYGDGHRRGRHWR